MTGRRGARVLAGATALLLLGALAAGCTSSGEGDALARQACVHVVRSVALYEESEHATSLAQGDALREEAATELYQAEPLAARATSDDGEWNGLMTTISEVSRVDESELLGSLQSSCAFADESGQPGLPGS